MEEQFRAGYEVRPTARGKQYVFFCELTGVEVCKTEPISEPSAYLALELAKKSARPYFNRCRKCGRWICDNAYNIDEMMCIECAPYPAPPRYCDVCGAPIKTGNCFCNRCGHQIL